MGIDIYARWKGQTAEEQKRQTEAWSSATEGSRGYLRESYHGYPYATKILCFEAFQSGEAQIPVVVLKSRLAQTLDFVEERERKLYKSSEEDIEKIKQSFRDFVALCELKERETGEPVQIVAEF